MLYGASPILRPGRNTSISKPKTPEKRIEIMNHRQIGRRPFLESAALGAAGIVLGRPLTTLAAASRPLKIEEPFHGAVLNHRHGTADGRRARHLASPARRRRGGSRSTASRPRQGEAFRPKSCSATGNEIVAAARAAAGRREDRVRVVWDRHPFPDTVSRSTTTASSSATSPRRTTARCSTASTWRCSATCTRSTA